jgi:hypothetical protein
LFLVKILELDVVSAFLNCDFLQFFVGVRRRDAPKEKVKDEIVEFLVLASSGEVTNGFEIAVFKLTCRLCSNMLDKEDLLLSVKEVAVVSHKFESFHLVLRAVNNAHHFLTNIFVEFFLFGEKAENIAGSLHQLQVSLFGPPDDIQETIFDNPVNKEF